MATKRTASRRGDRFLAPFISRMWRADGTPFTNDEYRKAGVRPPTAEQQAAFLARDAEGHGITSSS